MFLFFKKPPALPPVLVAFLLKDITQKYTVNQ